MELSVQQFVRVLYSHNIGIILSIFAPKWVPSIPFIWLLGLSSCLFGVFGIYFLHQALVKGQFGPVYAIAQSYPVVQLGLDMALVQVRAPAPNRIVAFVIIMVGTLLITVADACCFKPMIDDGASSLFDGESPSFRTEESESTQELVVSRRNTQGSVRAYY